MHAHISSFLSNHFKTEVSVLSVVPLSGGDINAVYKVKTSHGDFCIKQNHRSRFPEMLEKEAIGLKELIAKTDIRIPQVIGAFQEDSQQYLVLEFIESGSKARDFWETFGIHIASMHTVSSNHFGWHTDNYIGSLPQSNTRQKSWAEFYAHERILPQMQLAFDKGRIDRKLLKASENVCRQFETLFPKEEPALLHGDLWSGNYMVDASGNPVLIDPAVYYGHREMDLGMMHLFGGFSERLFDVYNVHFPLESDWESRIPLTQLYPLLVHLNLFGGVYVQDVQSVIQKYS